MGYYVTLRGSLCRETVALLQTEYEQIKEKYYRIEFDEYGFEYAGSWGYTIIAFFKELSRIIKKGSIVIDYDGDEPRDIKQFRISKNNLQQRHAKRIIFDNWLVFKDDF